MVSVKSSKEAFLGMGGRIDEERIITGEDASGYVVDGQYLFMGKWAFEKIRRRNPKLHVDIGGDIQMLNYLSCIVPVEHRDIRECCSSGAGYKFIKDDITGLHIKDNSVDSLSCLHVAEHIGLGRYGDSIDPEGHRKAFRELYRVLAPGGRLYFAVPTGRDKVVFNAHRTMAPHTILDVFKGLSLIGCGFVASSGHYYPDCNIETMSGDDYGCGMFEFMK